MDARAVAAIARRLFEDGVAVVPLLTADELARYHAGFRSAQRNFPEFTPQARVYVRGGFGALGNPASFHNSLVRALRTRAMFAAVPVFRAYEKVRADMRDAVDLPLPATPAVSSSSLASSSSTSGAAASTSTSADDDDDDSERTDTEDEREGANGGDGGGGGGEGRGRESKEEKRRPPPKSETKRGKPPASKSTPKPETKRGKPPASKSTPKPAAKPTPKEPAELAKEEKKRARLEKQQAGKIAEARRRCAIEYPRNECDPRRTYSRYLSQLFDRMSERKAGSTLTAESWHRDQAPECDTQADVFGGWVNFDLDAPQYFSCVPGTQRLARTSAPRPTKPAVATPSRRRRAPKPSSSSSSLSSVPPSASPPPVSPPGDEDAEDDDADPIAAGFSRVGPHETALYEKTKVEIEIPPGSWVVFNQSLVHEVRRQKTKLKRDSVRVYLGFRLGVCRAPLFPVDRVLTTQAVPPLPSGQRPPMYAQLAWLGPASRTAIAEWSRTSFVAKALVTRTVASGPTAGTAYRVVPQHMPSLLDLDLPLYVGYTAAERSLLMPRRTWRLTMPQLDLRGAVLPALPKDAKSATVALRMSARPAPPTPTQQHENQAATRRLVRIVRALQKRRADAQLRDSVAVSATT